MPFLLIVGVGAIISSSSQDTFSAPHTTSEPRVTSMRAATPGRTTTPEKAAIPRMRPSSQPTVSLLQVKVPSLPSWLPLCEWKDLPTTNNEVPTGLIDHPVYKANYPVGNCPISPRGFKNRESYTMYYEPLIVCLQKVWRPYLAALSVEQKSVDLVAYESNANTPYGSDNQNLTTFYCSGNTTIYMSRKKYEHDADYGQYAAQTVIHEHFHHVQNQLEILNMSKEFDADEMEVSRHIESQDIYSASRLQLTLNLGITADDYKSFSKTPLGDEEHGTKGTTTHWKNRGFYTTTLQSYNTWGVPSREVT